MGENEIGVTSGGIGFAEYGANRGQRVARVEGFIRRRRDQAPSNEMVLGLARGEEPAGVLEVGLGARKEFRIFGMGDPWRPS